MRYVVKAFPVAPITQVIDAATLDQAIAAALANPNGWQVPPYRHDPSEWLVQAERLAERDASLDALER